MKSEPSIKSKSIIFLMQNLNNPVIPTERSEEESLKHFKSDVNE